jgi:coenzyme PQQ precursor peptide PqqA
MHSTLDAIAKACTGGFYHITLRRFNMWTKPAATEMRFGFEVTMYVMNK